MTDRKFPDHVYEQIAAGYELEDDGRVRNLTTGELRPKFYSGLPIPFKVGDKLICVDGSHQFPVGKEFLVHSKDGDAIYVYRADAPRGSTVTVYPACWERFDSAPK